VIARRRPLDAPPAADTTADPGLPGTADQDGRARGRPAGAEELEVAAAEDAELRVGAERVPLRVGAERVPLRVVGGGALGADRTVVIEPLPPADRRLRVELRGPDGSPLAGRVAFRAHDGRVLPPLGHADTVNVGLYEDVGADLCLGGRTWAYMDGWFDIDLPADGAVAEIMAGPDRPAVRLDLGADDLDRGPLRVALGAAIAPRDGDWVSGDTHVHFSPPPPPWCRRGPRGHVVHLLATQWGDLVTNVLDRHGDQRHPDGRHVVWMGSENRQNKLGPWPRGRRAASPFASGGARKGAS